jgi:hypothetical protein
MNERYRRRDQFRMSMEYLAGVIHGGTVLIDMIRYESDAKNGRSTVALFNIHHAVQ